MLAYAHGNRHIAIVCASSCARHGAAPRWQQIESDPQAARRTGRTVAAPAGTPAAIVSKLNAQINASLNEAGLESRLEAEGAEATPATPQAFGELIAREIERWRPVVKVGSVEST